MFDFGLSKMMKQNAEVLAEQMHVTTTMIAPCDQLIFFKKTGLRSSLDFHKFQTLLGIVLVYNFDQALLNNRTLKKFCDYFTSSIREKFDNKFLTDYVEVSKRLTAMNEVGNNHAILGWVMYKLGIEDPSDDCIDFIYTQVMLKAEEAENYFLKGARIFSPD